jgi:hypothetical protein
MRRIAIVLGAAILVALACVLVLRREHVEVIPLATISSQNNKFTVAVQTEVYGSGFGTDYPIDTARLLDVAGHSYLLVSVESNGSKALARRVRWRSANELEIELPPRQRLIGKSADTDGQVKVLIIKEGTSD